MAAYGDDMRLVFKHYPLSFHERALPAAVAVECAGRQGEFWSMADTLFDTRALTDVDLRHVAETLLGPARLPDWEACLTSPEPLARIDADVALGDSVGISGTPALVVNGRMLVGALSAEDYRAVFDAELDKARRSGVPRERYYEEVVLRGAPL